MLTAINNITKSLLAMNPFPNIIKTPVDSITNTTDTTNNSNAPSEISTEFLKQWALNQAEKVENDIYDTRPYTVINLETKESEDFHYLHGEQLSKTYDFCSSSPSVPLKIHICMVGVEFQCNYDGDHLPFLRFLMENNAPIPTHGNNISDELSDDISDSRRTLERGTGGRVRLLSGDSLSSQDSSSLEENITDNHNMTGGYGSQQDSDIPELQELLTEDPPTQDVSTRDNTVLPLNTTAVITFPQCHINCISEDKDNTMDVYFHNECKKRVLDFFAIEGYFTKDSDFGERLNNSYRGYKEIGESEIVVVFDITSFMTIPLRKSKNPRWIVVDDLLAKVLPVSPKVLSFFEQNPYMTEIRDPLNTPVEIPKTVYLYNMETAQYMTQSDKSDWIEPRSRHETYGFFYYLKAASGDLSSQDNTRKCIVFLKNYADFIENDTSIELMGEHIKSSPANGPLPNVGGSGNSGARDNARNEHRNWKFLRRTAFGTMRGTSIGVSQDERKNKNIKDELVSSDNELADNPGEYDKEPIENNLPFISVIMFTENGETIYCVKTESIFMEL
jgi:hypothetical protein